jgi:hypothetical protein
MFMKQLDDEDLQKEYFQHDDATPQHTTRDSIFNNFMGIEL